LAIEPGMRGFSIEVAQGTSVGGNISVGDYVDVLVLLDTAPVEGSSTVPDLASISRDLVGNPDLPEPLVVNSQNGAATLAVTVVQNVKVLALDQTVSSQGSTGSSQSSSASAAGKEPNANTATLELTPQDVQTLALVSKYGSLLLSLRSFGDDAKEPVAPIAAGF
jgi:Flp pilus assembly protein CpaB